MRPTVFITGVTGFIGSSLAKHLHERGYRVFGSASRPLEAPLRNTHVEKLFCIHLGANPPPEAFAGVDIVVHAAHSLKRGSLSTNIEGTKIVAESALRAGVKKQIFLSSYSALGNNISEYAIAKIECEKIFRDMPTQTVIARPGLVIGPGGLFGRMIQMLFRTPVLPLLDGGNGKAPFISITDLNLSLEKLISDEAYLGEFNLFNPEKASLKDILNEIRTLSKRKVYFIPIPSSVLYIPILFAELLRIPLPVNSQNIKGYKANQEIDAASELLELLHQTESLTASIVRALKPLTTETRQ